MEPGPEERNPLPPPLIKSSKHLSATSHRLPTATLYRNEELKFQLLQLNDDTSATTEMTSPETMTSYQQTSDMTSQQETTTDMTGNESDDSDVIPYNIHTGKISSPRLCFPSSRHHLNTHRDEEQSPCCSNSPRSPNDEVRSAALALTSLSLSPANISGFDEAAFSPRPLSYPPHNNTPTDDSAGGYYSPRFYPNAAIDMSSTVSTRGEVSPPLSPSFRCRTFSQNTPNHDGVLKPRSYTTTQYPPPLERISKQRSYSFDAFGRSHKYYNEEEQFEPRRRSPSYVVSTDEGIGTSEGGSVESLETTATKRKLPGHRTGFRCMWRGCDKELSTLSAIILHVRHAHIGVARAGEEEFYFDDIKARLPCTRFSSTSSNEDSLPDIVSSSPRTIKTITDDNLEQDATPPVFTMSLSPELLTSPKRSKPVSVIQPVIPSAAVVRPREQYAFHGYTLANFDINQQQLNKMTGANNDKKLRRRIKSSGKKKCRKVYGMSNKDLWCTQCRWKKACVRFL